MKHLIQALVVVLLFSTINSQLSTVFAQNTVFTYQGRVTDNGTNFNGSGQFEFALVTSTNTSMQAMATANAPSGGFITGYTVTTGGTGYITAPIVTVTGGAGLNATATANVSGGVVTGLTVNSPGNGAYTSAPTVTIAPPPVNLFYTTYWSNDGTSVNGSEPSAAVNVTVNSGLFTVVLGDTTIPNMTGINASLFSQPNLQLRIWFNDGVHGFAVLSPAQNLTPAPYAITAENLSGGLTVQNNADGAPNVIGGSSINYISNDIVGATIAGGGATNYFGFAFSNTVTGNFGTVSGGAQNIASGYAATMGGGIRNTTTGEYATVGGGTFNTAGSIGATVGGGEYNTAGGQDATVGGGVANSASDSATVGGGDGNAASGDTATVGGGNENTASGFEATVGGGGYNSATNIFATVGGGEFNIASGNDTTVGGGSANTAINTDATVGGGTNNTASGQYSTVSGGIANTAGGQDSTVGGGIANTANNLYSTVSGGKGNTASGQYATVAGGNDNQASGDLSFAGGNHARAPYQGDFVWSDDNGGIFSAGAANQFYVRAGGGVAFYSSSGSTTGATLAPGSGSWSSVSDRNAKENFQSVDAQKILSAVTAMPMTTWNYKTQDKAIRHVGPMAQDFHAAFQVGENDISISTVDEGGVALAAIQGLNEKLEVRSQELGKQNAELKQQNDSLQKQLDDLKQIVQSLVKKN